MAFYNTFVNYNGNGSTTDFSVPFSYLDQDEVIVTFAGSGTYTYTFPSPNVIRVSPALASGASVRIERQTDLTAAKVVYSNGSPVPGSQLNASTGCRKPMTWLVEHCPQMLPVFGMLRASVSRTLQRLPSPQMLPRRLMLTL
jgi:hypothetical protein